jgi:hypothetical protein
MKKLFFTVENVNQIFAYLGQRPYQEVYQLVDMMQKVVADQQQEPTTEVQVETPGETND